MSASSADVARVRSIAGAAQNQLSELCKSSMDAENALSGCIPVCHLKAKSCIFSAFSWHSHFHLSHPAVKLFHAKSPLSTPLCSNSEAPPSVAEE